MRKLERIMLVDDDSNMNLLNQLLFEDANATENFITFPNGLGAIEYLKEGKNKVDLILLDINMPLMDGWSFLDEYEKLEDSKKASIVIVMLTSSVNRDDRERAESYKSIARFINKPITSELVTEIMELF